MATTGDSNPGIDGTLIQRSPGSETSLTMDTDSIEDMLAKITSAGGAVVLGRTAIPHVGWFATCKDTEGNTFGLFTNDPAAG